MYPTAEVRWFAEGSLPDEVERWFRAVAGEQSWEARTDRYVRPASPDGLGVKVRAGRLEVKRLAAVVGEDRLHERATGRVECWRKWSFPLGAGATLYDARGDWVSVEKRRQKGTFAVRNGDVERVQREEQAGQGCSLEVAEVEVAEQTWWSVGFEAFGTYEQIALLLYLRHAATHVFAAATPPALSAEQSMSYPAWLCALSNE